MEEDGEKSARRRQVGADLILPVLAVLYAIYYLTSIAGAPQEARINGVFVSTVLLALIALFALRTLGAVFSGHAGLGLDKLIAPTRMVPRRLGFILLTAAAIALMPWLGFTLDVLAFLLAAMLLLGVRRPLPLAAIPLISAAAGYGLFIVLLKTRLPAGLLEHLLGAVF